MKLDARSVDRLRGVHADLVKVVLRAAEITDIDFMVTEGVRTVMRQAELFKAGATRTMKSKHLIGRAVDLAAIVDGDVRWDWNLYFLLAGVMKTAVAYLTETNVPADGQPVDSQKAARESFQDLIWALINTKEFLFNH